VGDRTEAPIPFVPNQESGVEELAGASPVAMNITIDSRGAIGLRPGIGDYVHGPQNQTTSSNPILNLWPAQSGKLYAIQEFGADRKLMQVGATLINLSTHDASLIEGDQRPIIAETETGLFITAGYRPSKVLNSVGYPQILGGDPPKGTHVVANNSRLLINEFIDTTTLHLVQWSDLSGQATGGYEGWNLIGTSGFFQGLPNAEPVLAMAENSQQVFIWGRTKFQIWSPDTSFTYAPEAAREIGISAPYSVVKTDESFCWLDHMRRFVMSDGRSIQPISDPAIQQTLNDMASVSDCHGFRYVEGNTDALVWVFPTDGRTFVYQKGSGWSQWSSWNGVSWGQLNVNCHVLRPDDDTNLVGTLDGRVGVLKTANGNDFGQSIRAFIVTGFQDRGTSARKHCRAVRLTLRRGDVGSTDEPVGRLFWRDDLGEWNPGLMVGFGAVGDYTTVVRLTGLGTYRTRQWKFEFMTHTQLAGAVEEYEVLGN
jgi:hypothetical protein